MKIRYFKPVAAATAAIVAACAFSACAPKENDPPPKPEPTYLSALRVDGSRIYNAENREVFLRGVNAGGVCVIEQWMNGFKQSYTEESGVKCIDHKTTTRVFEQRFGREKTKKLWAEYRNNIWNERDFRNCAEMGMNVIRLPFTYMTVDFDATFDYADAGKNYDFSVLDEFVVGAAEHGMYTILDLHGAYGSQNGQDHSGEVLPAGEVGFYSDEQAIELTVKLWGAVAEHFKDNPNIAGYDILNEPAEKIADGKTDITSERHFRVFDRIYDEIREKDDDGIVIFESCWEGANLPRPSEYGWENCIYSFHHYTNCTGGDRFDEHKNSWDNKLKGIDARNFGVPLYMGEFSCYTNEDQWDYTVSLLNSRGWHWTSWTYKINNTFGNSAWGIVRIDITDKDKVNAHEDSYETILDKFAGLYTEEDVTKFVFTKSGRTLFDKFKKYCGAEE